MKPTMLLVLCGLLAAPVMAEETAGMVEKDGLAVSIKPAATHFPAGQALTFNVELKNTSRKAWALYDANCWVYEINTPNGSWACELEDVKTKAKYKPTVTVRPMIARITIPVLLAPGKVSNTRITLTRALSYVPVAERPGAKKPGQRLMLSRPLPDGKYKVHVTMTFRKAEHTRVKIGAPYWTGTLKVTTAEFQVGGKMTVQAGVWHKLHADERWYKNQRGKEREFTGVLKVKPKPKPGEIMASTLQRECYYFVGEWRVYTGAKRVAVLEQLGGKNVVIRGKAVEMNLEGQHLKEIWPATVKLAK